VGIININHNNKSKMKILVSTLVVLMVFISCTSNKIVTEAQQKEMILWGNKTPFKIVSHRASPTPTAAFSAVANSGLLAPGNTAANISLIGNANFFKMDGDTISAYLPYFGERRFGSNYGSNEGGISFNDKPLIKEISYNVKKQRAEMHFRIKQERDNEIYDILILIFANHSAHISVNSSERTPINYYGEIKPLETKGIVKEE